MPSPRSSNLAHRTAGVGKTHTIKWSSDEQRQLFMHGPTPVCASGGWGSGKTMGASLKALWVSSIFARNRGVIARRLWEELRKTTMATFFKICPPEAYNDGGRRSDQEKILRLNNGSEILWMHMDDPEIETVINGLEINWFFLDQAEEIDERIFDKLLGRLGRWDAAEVPDWLVKKEIEAGREWANVSPFDGRPMPPTYAILDCNPSDESHWIYRRFHPDSDEHDAKIHTNEHGALVSYKDLGYTMIDMPSTINKFLSKQNLSTLLSQDESIKRRFVYGKWGNPEGTIHTIHADSLVPGTQELLDQLTHTCTLYRVLDHGESAPTCCTWWAADRNGNLFCYREYYMPNTLISQHRTNIKNMATPDEVYANNLADPSIFFKGGQRAGIRWSVAEEYSDASNLPKETAIYWMKADNDELSIRNRINEYLRFDPDHISPITGKRGSPRIFFLVKSEEYQYGCRHVLRELRAQRRIQLGSDLGKPTFTDERDDAVTDHAYDTVRYFVGSRPPVAPGISIRNNPKSFMAVRKNMLDFANRGGFKMLAQRARITKNSFASRRRR